MSRRRDTQEKTGGGNRQKRWWRDEFGSQGFVGKQYEGAILRFDHEALLEKVGGSKVELTARPRSFAALDVRRPACTA